MPDDERTFSVDLQLGVGPIDGPGADDWQLHVRSADIPGPLAESTANRDAWWSGSSLVLTRWDYFRVLREFDIVCRRARSATWSDVDRQLDPYGHGPPVFGSLDDVRLQELQDPTPRLIEDLSIIEQFQRMKKGHLLEEGDVKRALSQLTAQDGRFVWFWGLTDAAVQAFWLSIYDDLLMRTLRDNISTEVRYVLQFSDDPRERKISEAFDTREFAAFYDEIDARVWDSLRRTSYDADQDPSLPQGPREHPETGRG